VIRGSGQGNPKIHVTPTREVLPDQRHDMTQEETTEVDHTVTHHVTRICTSKRVGHTPAPVESQGVEGA
jgi:hypothetical protein